MSQMPVDWGTSSRAPGVSGVGSGPLEGSENCITTNTVTAAAAATPPPKHQAPYMADEDPMRRVWVMDAYSLQPWGAWKGTGEQLKGVRPTKRSPLPGATTANGAHPHFPPYANSSGHPAGGLQPHANAAAGCTRRQPLDFFADVHPEDAPIARDFLALPPWRRAGFAVSPVGAAESSGSSSSGGLGRRVRVPVYRRRKADLGGEKVKGKAEEEEEVDGLRAEWIGPDGTTWTIFECVAWLEAGSFTVVAERPRPKPPHSPDHHAPTSPSSPSPRPGQSAASRYLPHSPFSSIEPMIAVLDSRPGGARGEGDGLFAPTFTCVGDMTRELTMHSASNSGNSATTTNSSSSATTSSSQLARNDSIALAPQPRPSILPAAPTTVVEVVRAGNLSSLSADLLR